jgi:hypothetical protein
MEARFPEPHDGSSRGLTTQILEMAYSLVICLEIQTMRISDIRKFRSGSVPIRVVLVAEDERPFPCSPYGGGHDSSWRFKLINSPSGLILNNTSCDRFNHRLRHSHRRATKGRSELVQVRSHSRSCGTVQSALLFEPIDYSIFERGRIAGNGYLTKCFDNNDDREDGVEE